MENLKANVRAANQVIQRVGTDIDVLSEQISEIVEIRQRLGRINRYANKFKYWNESEDTNK